MLYVKFMKIKYNAPENLHICRNNFERKCFSFSHSRQTLEKNVHKKGNLYTTSIYLSNVDYILLHNTDCSGDFDTMFPKSRCCRTSRMCTVALLSFCFIQSNSAAQPLLARTKTRFSVPMVTFVM